MIAEYMHVLVMYLEQDKYLYGQKQTVNSTWPVRMSAYILLIDTDHTDIRSLINSWIGENIQVVLQSTNKQVGLTETRVLIFGQRPVQLIDMASPLLN